MKDDTMNSKRWLIPTAIITAALLAGIFYGAPAKAAKLGDEIGGRVSPQPETPAPPSNTDELTVAFNKLHVKSLPQCMDFAHFGQIVADVHDHGYLDTGKKVSLDEYKQRVGDKARNEDYPVEIAEALQTITVGVWHYKDAHPDSKNSTMSEALFNSCFKAIGLVNPQETPDASSNDGI